MQGLVFSVTINKLFGDANANTLLQLPLPYISLNDRRLCHDVSWLILQQHRGHYCMIFLNIYIISLSSEHFKKH